MLDAADPRQRVAISLMAFAGFRDQTLGDLTGVDRLKIKDFPEMQIVTQNSATIVRPCPS